MRKRAGKMPNGGAARPLRPRKATMKDVADLAGVSLATVSRTLSAAAEVSPRLSRRVQAAARRLDYAVNINARGLRGKSSGLVVVLLPDIANPFFSVLLQGIEEQARSHDMAVLIGDTGVDHAIAETYWRLIDGQRADGIILLNGFLPFPPGKRAVADYPMVVVSERIAGVDAPIVGIDNVAAAFDAVSYLARLGHRRVAYICGPADNVLTGERRDGYKKAVEANDLERWPEAIQPGEFSIRAGRVATDAPAGRLAAADGGLHRQRRDRHRRDHRGEGARSARPRGPVGRRLRRYRNGADLRSAADHDLSAAARNGPQGVGDPGAVGRGAGNAGRRHAARLQARRARQHRPARQP